MRKQKVLFLCTQNSARSQMAEGFLRHLAGDRFEVYSAGIDPTPERHPCAIEAMSEVGIDISEQYPRGLRTYLGKWASTTSSSCAPALRSAAPRPFRAVRDESELKIKDWLEHPEEELRKLREERERERRERMEASQSEIGVSSSGDGRPDPFARA
jgi:arsenate reductase